MDEKNNKDKNGRQGKSGYDPFAMPKGNEIFAGIANNGEEQPPPVINDRSSIFEGIANNGEEGASLTPAVCSSCGAPLDRGANFCRSCGAPVENVCPSCGQKVSLSDKFCRGCGARIGVSQPVQPTAHTVAPLVVSPVDRDTKKLRLIVILIYGITAFFGAIIGFAFLCTPFISVRATVGGQTVKYMETGISLIAIMGGNASSLCELGVAYNLLRVAGWAALGYILSMVVSVVCVSVGLATFSRTRPHYILFTGILTAVFGIQLFIYGVCMASAVKAYGGTVKYAGSVGVFMMSLIYLAGTITAHIFTDKAYEKEVGKKRSSGRIACTTVCAFFVAIIALSALSLLSPGYSSELTVRPGSKGDASVYTDEKYDKYYIGATVFKLEGLEPGETYAFYIKTEDATDSSKMYDTVVLCLYADVAGKPASELLDTRILMENQSVGNSSARLVFENDFTETLAVVVNFASEVKTTVSFYYTFGKV